MVMHARKPPRISDGYFDKHQTHPYQNSKYSTSSKGGTFEGRYNHERMRDSPNGNSYRSDSPDSHSQSPRDRTYTAKSSSYLHKKERENRDYQKPRDKYPDCSRSPKDKRSRESRDSEHRTNHDRSSTEKIILHPIKLPQNSSRETSQRKPPLNSCPDKREDRERVARVGDWTEHISSSGKKYYYNCKTEVSQWEKPREWVERERDRGNRGGGGGGGGDRDRERERDRERDRDRDREKARDRDNAGGSYSTSNSGRSCKTISDRYLDQRPHDKHSMARTSMNNSRNELQMSSSKSAGSSSSSSSRTSTSAEKRDYWSTSRDDSVNDMSVGHDRRKHSNDNNLIVVEGPNRSKSSSTSSIGHHSHQQQDSQAQDMDISPGDSTPTSETSSSHPPGGSIPPSSSPGGPVLLANALPRIGSHTNQYLSSPPPNAQLNSSSGVALNSGVLNASISAVSSGVVLAPPVQGDSSSSGSLQPLKVDTPVGGVPVQGPGGAGEGGPPTPTHSESQDCLDARKCLTSPPTSSLSSLQSLTQVAAVSSSLHALRPQGPHLTPSLANHYRDDLVNHVRNWPADALEKQAQKLSEDGYAMGSLQCTRVSAELKSARSVVRFTEIQATLQEQRILFLRQQIKTLEQLKSQNSFMSDDS